MSLPRVITQSTYGFPGAYTMPWNAVQRYDRVNQGWLSEFICPENNLNFGDLDPMPVAAKPDF